MTIPTETLTLILMLPVVATVIAFLRQVVGIRAFGIYTPLIITFAFLATGLKFGLLIFVIVLLTGTLARVLVRRLHLLYLPRMAVVLSIVALVIYGLFWLAASYGGSQELVSLSIFPILIIIILVEKFVSAQIDKGTQVAIRLSIETLILSIAFYIASWPWLQQILINQPGWIVLTIIINVLMGSWSGLRLVEYFKYREIIRHDSSRHHQE